MNENKVKHLEFIQAIVARLGSNSFLLKGWSVTLATALFALAGNGSNSNFAFVAFFPALAFWVLDAYYLHQERLFRKLYDDVRTPSDAPQVESFSLSTVRYTNQVNTWLQCMFAPSVLAIHGIVIIAIVVAVVIVT